jgi:hypothetical protein
MTTNTNNLPAFIDVFAITDAEDSDPDPIFEGATSDLTAALGDVSLAFLFHDDDMNHDVFNVLDAQGVVIAIAYA